jgi:hypothetical protein
MHIISHLDFHQQTVNTNNIFSMLKHANQKTIWTTKTKNYNHNLQS